MPIPVIQKCYISIALIVTCVTFCYYILILNDRQSLTSFRTRENTQKFMDIAYAKKERASEGKVGDANAAPVISRNITSIDPKTTLANKEVHHRAPIGRVNQRMISPNKTSDFEAWSPDRKITRHRLCPITVHHSHRNLTPPWGNDDHPDFTVTLPVPAAYNPNFKNPCWFATRDGIEKLQCLPYFFLAGFPKSGTSDLFFKMSKHPEIRPSVPKEPVWWARERYSGKRFRSYMSMLSFGTDYLKILYSNNHTCPVKTVIGDGSTSTVWDNSKWRNLPGNKNQTEPRILTAHHIKYYLPDARIIIILRNPITRLYSDYNFFWRTSKSDWKGGPSAAEFHDRVVTAIKEMDECQKTSSLRACTYDRAKFNRVGVGLYTVFLEDWMKIFPREQIHMLTTDDYQKNERLELTKIFKFLGLRGDIPDAIYKELTVRKRKNVRENPSEMFKQTREILQKFYDPFNRRLAQLLGDEKYLWMT